MSLKDTIKKKPMTADEIEKAAEAIHQPQKKETKAAPEKDARVKHRLTIDLPAWLVEEMKSDIEQTGQTLKGVVLQLLLDKYRK